MRLCNPDFALGLVVLVAAALAIFAWVPMDTGSGLVERVRGRVNIGDAMAPTMTLCVLALAGALLMLESFRKPVAESVPTFANLRYVGLLTGLFGLSVLLMRWTGPAAVFVAGALDLVGASYRELRDTVPWKYLGFLVGGTFLVGSLICLAEHRVTWRSAAVGLLAVLALIALYDLPFDDLLLPPNGDV